MWLLLLVGVFVKLFKVWWRQQWWELMCVWWQRASEEDGSRWIWRNPVCWWEPPGGGAWPWSSCTPCTPPASAPGPPFEHFYSSGGRWRRIHFYFLLSCPEKVSRVVLQLTQAYFPYSQQLQINYHWANWTSLRACLEAVLLKQNNLSASSSIILFWHVQWCFQS